MAGEPSPGADVGEPSPSAVAAGVSPVPLPMLLTLGTQVGFAWTALTGLVCAEHEPTHSSVCSGTAVVDTVITIAAQG